MAGVEASMMESATVLMTGHVNVGGFYKVTSGTAAPLVTDYEKVLAETRKNVPELDYATVRVRGWAKGVSDRSSMDLVLSGVDVRNEPGFPKVVRVQSGRLEDLAQPGTLLLFEDQARRLEVQVGDVITLSAPTFRGQNNTADVRVVAIAQNAGLISAFTAFLEAGTLRGLYNLREGNTGAIHLYLKDPGASARVAARLRGNVAEQHYLRNPDPGLFFGLVTDFVDSSVEKMSGDTDLMERARQGIRSPNEKYPPVAGSSRFTEVRFALLHRERRWNPSEVVWMGWERKRGKLHELKRLLRGTTDTTFLTVDAHAPAVPPGVRYVVTLDADTRLPSGAVWRLVGKMAHPLNRPTLDPHAGRVVEGYAVLQPRVTPSLPTGREESLFQRVFSGPCDMDPYAFAVSD